MRAITITLTTAAIVLLTWYLPSAANSTVEDTSPVNETTSNHKPELIEKGVAIFAGGCFWCLQPPFDRTPGVTHTEVGYTGGHVPNPTYEDISEGTTGHFEAIKIEYDPQVTTYAKLLDVFWKNIDPTQKDGQFADRGPQYRTAVFYATPAEQAAADESKTKLEQSKKFSDPVSTMILPLKTYYPAENYHQNYYKTNSRHYEAYSEGSGRKGFIRKIWKEETK